MNTNDDGTASNGLLPRIIFGTSALGNLYRELDGTEKRHLVAEWFRCTDAPTCIDSAGKYGAGLALQALGESLRALSISPRDVIISNKLGWKRVPLNGPVPTFEPGIWKNLSHDAVQAIGGEEILECWRQGNALLGAPYQASLLSVHDPDEYLLAATSAIDRGTRVSRIRDAYRALDDLKRSGKATAIGVGSKSWTIIRELSETIRFDWVMLAGSLTVRVHCDELLAFVEELHRNGVQVINSAVFNSGFLVGSDYFDYRPVTRETDPGLFAWRDRFHEVCRKYDVLPADACVEFGLAHRGVLSVALNTTRASRVSDNVQSISRNAPAPFWQQLRSEGLIMVTPEELA